MKFRWSGRALKRLTEIAEFISADSYDRAKELCDRLLAVEDQLGSFPYSGALVPEDGAYRQVVVERYRVVYLIDAEEVVVVTVVEPGRMRDDSRRE